MINSHIYRRILEQHDRPKQVTLEGKKKEVNTKTRRDHQFFLNKVFSDATKRVNDKYRSGICSKLSKAVDADKMNNFNLKDNLLEEAEKLHQEWQFYSRTEKFYLNSKFRAMQEADKKKNSNNSDSSECDNSGNPQNSCSHSQIDYSDK